MTAGSAALRPRGFRLLVEAERGEAYGLRLEETNGSPQTPPAEVARAGARRTRRVIESVLAALRESRLERTALSARRRAPLELEEVAGVRLALVLVASAPLTKLERVDAVASGVAAMSTEEAFYWYAKCMSAERARGRRALRLLLAGE